MNIWCKLLGHKFWMEGWGRGGIVRVPLPRCDRCALTKVEAGITN